MSSSLTIGSSGWSCALPVAGQHLWHDTPVFEKVPQEILVTTVVEIPKDSLTKSEVNPETGKVSDNEKASATLRKFGKAPPFNYGIFPQTYCDPDDKEKVGDLELGGDQAALDAVILSDAALDSGAICYQSILLGCFLVVDKGELDWKVVTVPKQQYEEWMKSLGGFGTSVKLMNLVTPMLAWFEEWYAFKVQAKGGVFDEKKTFANGKCVFGPSEALNRVQRAHKGWAKLYGSPSAPSAPSQKRELQQLAAEEEGQQPGSKKAKVQSQSA